MSDSRRALRDSTSFNRPQPFDVVEVQFNLAKQLSITDRARGAYRLFQTLGNMDHPLAPVAKAELAHMEVYGRGTKPNPERGLKTLTTLADAGNNDARTVLASIYLDETSGFYDKREGIVLLSQAKNAGSTSAANALRSIRVSPLTNVILSSPPVWG